MPIRRGFHDRGLNEHISSPFWRRKKVIAILFPLIVLPLTVLSVFATTGKLPFFSSIEQTPHNSSEVLASTTKSKKLFGDITFNIPAIFKDKVTINAELLVTKAATFTENVTVKNKNLTLGTGKLTASNVVYGITAGDNITISGDTQNPVISAVAPASVTSLQGQQGELKLAEGTGIALDGLTITNSDPGSAQKFFSVISIDGTEIKAGENKDTFTFAQGDGITLSADEGSKTLTITNSLISSQWKVSGSDIYYNTGKVGIGTASPTTTLDVAGTGRFSGDVTLSSLTSGSLVFAGTGGTLQQDNSSIFFDDINNLLGIGTATPEGKLHVTGNAIGKALTIFNETGNQDILTASASGTTRLTLSNGGNLNLIGGVYQSGGVNGATIGSASCVLTTGGIVTGSAPCDTGNTSWLDSNGAIYPGNSTLDLLVGATASNSAKFAVLNVNSGTPTASVSAGANGGTFLTAAGNLQTTTKQSLTLGGGNTGNIVLSGFGTGLIHSSATGVLSSSALNLAGGVTEITNTLPVGNGGTGATTFTTNGVLYGNSASPLQVTAAPNPGQLLLGNVSNVPTFTTMSGDIAIDSAGLTTVQANAVALGTDTTGNYQAGTTAGNGIGVTGAAGEGWSPTIALGNLTSNWVQNNSFDIVLNNSNSQLKIMGGDGNNYGILDVGVLGSGDRTFVFPDFNQASAFVCLSIGNCSGTGGTVTGSGTANVITKWSTGSTLGDSSLYDNGNIGIGTVTPAGKLTVSSAVTGKALVMLNETGDQNLLTASASGITQFSIDRNGNMGIAGSTVSSSNYVTAPNFVLNTSGQVTSGVWQGTAIGSLYGGTGLNTSASTGVPSLSAGTWSVNAQLPLSLGGTNANLTAANGGILYSGPSALAISAIGVTGQCLTSNGAGAPTWQYCALGNPANWFTQTNGALYPINSSLDFLIGGSATASAKFGFINVASGTPTASISAGTNGGFYITADGILSTTAKQTLTIGTNTTGNIAVNGFNTGLVHSNALGVLSSSAVALGGTDVSGTLGPTNGGTGQNTVTTGDILYGSGANTWGKLAVGSAGQVLSVQSGAPAWISTSSINFWQRANGVVAPLNITDDLLLGSTATTSARIAFLNIAGGTPTASLSGTTSGLVMGADGSLQSLQNGSLTIGGATTGNLTLSGRNGANNGISLSGYATGLLHADATGRLTSSAINLANSDVTGTLGVSNGGTAVTSYTAGDILYATGATTLAKLGIGSPGQLLTVSGSAPAWVSNSAVNYWQRTNGAVSPLNITDDLLLGSTASISAKFAVLNIAGGTPTASVSAGITGGTFLTADGTLSTTTKQTLTLGSNSTGNIAINGFATGLVHSNASGVLSSSAVNLANSDVTGTLGAGNGGTGLASYTAGDILYATGATTLTKLGIGSAGQILSVSGSAPSWISSSAINVWQRTNGAVAPLNITDDLLLGATATTSAKFAFINVAGGTPIASVSAGTAGGIYLSADGTISTTAKQTLTLGSGSNGNIAVNGFGAGLLHTNASGILSTSAVNLANSDITGTLGVGNGGTGATSLTSNGVLYGGATVGSTTAGTNGQLLLGVSAAAPIFATMGGDATILNNGTLTLVTGAVTSGKILDNTIDFADISDTPTLDATTSIALSNFNLNLGTNAGTGTVVVAPKAGGQAALIINKQGNNDIFSASASGTTRLTLTNAGNLNLIGGAYQINGTSIIDASRNLNNIAGVATDLTPTVNNSFNLGSSSNRYANIYGQAMFQNGSAVCDTSGNCSGLSVNYWDQTNGSIYPKNTTVDFFVGATATSSAKFAVLNVNSGTPVASISAGLNGAAFLTADGNLQTTAKQTLTLGGGNTGNLALSAGALTINGSNGVTTGSPTCVTTTNGIVTGTGACAGGSGSNWNIANGAIYPVNNTLDMLVGSAATSSAKFAVINVNSGTPVASVSAGTSGGFYLTADGILATTAKQTLTLGSNSTGNIAVNGFTTGLLHANASGVLSSSAIALGSADVSGTLGPTNGGTGQNTVTTGDLLYGSGVNTWGKLGIGSAGQVLSVQSGAPAWISTSSINFWQRANGAVAPLNITDDLLLGATASTSAKFAFMNVAGGTPTASISGTTANSATFLTGGGTLGTTNKQTLTIGSASTGDIAVNGFTTGLLHANASGVLSSSAVNLSTSDITGTLGVSNGGTNVTSYTAGDLLYATGATTLTKLGIGTSGQILSVSGSAPSWISSAAINSWQRANGSVAPLNITDDLLLGSTATTSAKFAFLNVAGGTPTASVSAGAAGGIYLTASGTISTTAEQTLTLGSASTGNIVINGFGAGMVHANASGVLSSSAVNLANSDVTGTLGPTNGGTGQSTVTTGDLLYGSGVNTWGKLGIGSAGQVLSVQSGAPAWISTSSINFWQRANGAVAPLNITDDLLLGATSTTSAKFAFMNVAGGAPTASISGTAANNATFLTGDGTLGTTNRQTLTIGSSSTGNIAINGFSTGLVHANSSGVLSSSAVNLATSDVTGTLGAGNGGTGLASYTAGDILYATGATTLAKLGIGSAGQVLGISGSAPSWISTSSINYWQRANGAVAPLNLTDDFLLGSTASTSAKFAVLNIAGGTPVASVSATTSGIVLSADGSLQSLQNGSLTIGGSTTGNLILSGRNGTNNGIVLSGYSTGLVHADSTGRLTSSAINLANSDVTGTLGIGNGGTGVTSLTTNGVLFGGATIGATSVGATGTVLHGNTGSAPTFSAVDLVNDTTGVLPVSKGGSPWNAATGAIYPGNTTLDLLLGANATSSARFAVLNINSGTPVASVSAGTNGGAFLTADGNLQTTTKQTLTLGGGNTGNITISGFAAGIVHSSATGVLSSAAVNLANTDVTGTLGVSNGGTGFGGSYTAGDILYATGATTLAKLGIGSAGQLLGISGSAPSWVSSSSVNFWQRAAGVMAPLNITDDLLLGSTATTSAKFAFVNVIAGTPTASVSAGTAGGTYLTSDGKLATTAKQSLTLGDTVTTGNVIINPSGNIGIGTTAPGAKLDINGNLLVQGGGTIDTRASGTLAIGNATATTITLGRSGQGITLPGFATNNNSVLVTGASGALSEVTTASSGLCLLSNTAPGAPSWQTCPNGSASSTFWSQSNGALYPYNSTVDLLVGAQASSSAKFAILNVATGTPTASVSAAAGGLSLTATGGIQTTNKQSLTLGGGNTGNLVLSGFGSGIVHTNATGGLSTTTVDLATEVNGILSPLSGGTGIGSIGGSGSIVYVNASSYGYTLAGTAGQVLTSGGSGTPTWSDPSNIDYFDRANGAIYPKIATVHDLLLGSNATSSAKFAFTNVFGGTPTASISANTANNRTYMTGAGVLGTTNAQTLSLGAAGTGNVVIASGGTTSLTAVGANLTGAGTLTQSGLITATSGVSVAAGQSYTGAGAVTLSSGGGGALTLDSASNTLTVASSDTLLTATGLATITSANSLSLNPQSGTSYTLDTSGTTMIAFGTPTNLTLGGAAATFNIGPTGATAASVNIAGGSGATGCTIDGATGNLACSGNHTTTSTSGIQGWFQRNAGALASTNITDDLLLGSTATGSAKFGFINVAGGTPTASISATSNNATYVTATGTLGTTNAQTLTLGSGTGDINLNVGSSTLRIAGTAGVTINSGQCVTTTNGIVTGNIACDLGNASWVSTNGALYSGNSTLDLLVGANSSASAVFKVSPSGTSPTASISANTSNVGLMVDNRGLGDLFTASKSGKTMFTIKNSGVVLIGNSTDGITFDYSGVGVNGLYAGNARPTKKITLSPEYAGAILTASGSATTNGFMTSDASASAATANFETYYEWTSTQTALNDYTVAVRFTLPADFSAWTPSNALTIRYNTELGGNGSNKLDVIVYNAGSSLTDPEATTPVAMRTAQNTSSKTWTDLSIDDSDLTDGGNVALDTQGETGIIYLKMYSKDSNHVQISDITLNYLSKF